MDSHLGRTTQRNRIFDKETYLPLNREEGEEEEEERESINWQRIEEVL